MQWLLLGVLVIIWAAFLIPIGRRRSDSRSVEDFERRMELLANAEVHGTTGRWIVTPRKGVRFLGPRERQQARARARRRRVFVFLLEAIALTLLIGGSAGLRPVQRERDGGQAAASFPKVGIDGHGNAQRYLGS